MSNIEIPAEIQANAQRVLDGRDFHMATTVVLAEFILGLNKPENKAEPFVIYKVQVRGDDDPRMGFRVEKDVPYPWVTFRANSLDKVNAYPLAENSLIHRSAEIEVIERWTPELEFGIGDAGENVSSGREVLVKGTLGSYFVDDEGDVRVEMVYSDDLTDSHYVRATDVVYVKENNGN